LQSGIPDGIIVQRSVRVHIETKNWDWFYDSQLENHLNDLAKEDVGLKVLLALGKFESDDLSRFERIRELCSRKHKGTIIFNSVSFEDFLKKIEISGVSKNLADTISDFKQFLNEENLLPSWREWLDVVNCVGIPHDVTEGHVYMCPTEGGSYNHDRCRYFGMYRNKRVELVAEIEAIVDVDLVSNSELLRWKNGAQNDLEYKAQARRKVDQLRPGATPTRVFLLGPLFETDFIKDSPGGMQQSKRYFNVAHLGARNAAELAESLKNRVWSDLLKIEAVQ